MGWIDRAWKRANGAVFEPFWKAVGQTTAGANDEAQDAVRRKAAAMAPIVWLLGKTGSGKTSIVAALTEDPRAEIGTGYRPCTRRSSIYDWPAEAPVVRFLDTRGLGEPGYDPAEDMAYAEGQAHVVLATMKVADPLQDEVLSALKKIRSRHPRWPVIVAQTTLHSLYPRGANHPSEYPYRGGDADEANATLPQELRRALRYQRSLFEGLKGPPPTFVAIDFTLPEDGYGPAAFGLVALKAALEEAGVAVFRAAEEDLAQEFSDDLARKAHPLVIGYAAAAGAAGAVPIPVVGIGGLASSIGLMLRALAGRYRVEWSPARISEFAGAIGTGALLGFGFRYGIGELLKLVPVAGTLAGAALNAAAASALTYAIGRAACVYLGAKRRGKTVSESEVRGAFRQAIDEAFKKLRAAKGGRTEPAGETAS